MTTPRELPRFRFDIIVLIEARAFYSGFSATARNYHYETGDGPTPASAFLACQRTCLLRLANEEALLDVSFVAAGPFSGVPEELSPKEAEAARYLKMHDWYEVPDGGWRRHGVTAFGDDAWNLDQAVGWQLQQHKLLLSFWRARGLL